MSTTMLPAVTRKSSRCCTVLTSYETTRDPPGLTMLDVLLSSLPRRIFRPIAVPHTQVRRSILLCVRRVFVGGAGDPFEV
jgi:hypothetical protein